MSRYAKKLKPSPMRRALLNLYGPLSRDPSLGGICRIDAEALLAFLDRVNERSAVKVTITHVLLKMIGDSFRKFPELNVKVIGRRLYRLEHVDIRVSVNLFPEGDDAPEVSLAMVRDVDRKGLLEIARELTTSAQDHRRTGKHSNVTGKLLRLTRYVPDTLYDASMEIGRALYTSGRLAALGIARDPMGATALTNVGSFGLPEGVGDVMISGLLPPFGYASLFMALPVEERPVAIDGSTVVRHLLPFGAAMDHRAIDGYRIFRYFYYYAKVLTHPDEHFGLST